VEAFKVGVLICFQNHTISLCLLPAVFIVINLSMLCTWYIASDLDLFGICKDKWKKYVIPSVNSYS